ncbi:MAG: YdcF family protein [Pseudomonadota bacterium]
MIGLKVLTLLLQPPGAAVLALLVALALWRRRRVAAVLVVFALAWLWLWATPPAAQALRSSLEQRYPVLPIDALPSADAIVVLGGGVEPPAPPRRPMLELRAGADRVLHAAELYRAGKAPRIVVSGGRLPWTGGANSEADAMRALLLQLGVPDSAILREDKSRTTRENMRYTAALLSRLEVRRVLLVTSALHMPRAMANAAALGVEVIAAPTDVEVIPGRRFGVLAWLPDAYMLERSAAAFKEYLGLMHHALFSNG